MRATGAQAAPQTLAQRAAARAAAGLPAAPAAARPARYVGHQYLVKLAIGDGSIVNPLGDPVFRNFTSRYAVFVDDGFK